MPANSTRSFSPVPWKLTEAVTGKTNMISGNWQGQPIELVLSAKRFGSCQCPSGKLNLIGGKASQLNSFSLPSAFDCCQYSFGKKN
jgi:hypothetical protein